MRNIDQKNKTKQTNEKQYNFKKMQRKSTHKKRAGKCKVISIMVDISLCILEME